MLAWLQDGHPAVCLTGECHVGISSNQALWKGLEHIYPNQVSPLWERFIQCCESNAKLTHGHEGEVIMLHGRTGVQPPELHEMGFSYNILSPL